MKLTEKQSSPSTEVPEGVEKARRKRPDATLRFATSMKYLNTGGVADDLVTRLA
jgi:hypothetical protein